MSELEIGGGSDSEFEAIMGPVEEEQSDRAKSDEWHMYAKEDPDFRMAVIKHISELTGVRTGREFFDGDEA